MYLIIQSGSRVITITFETKANTRRKNKNIYFFSFKETSWSLTSSTHIFYRTWSHCHAELLVKLQNVDVGLGMLSTSINIRFLTENKSNSQL